MTKSPVVSSSPRSIMKVQTVDPFRQLTDYKLQVAGLRFLASKATYLVENIVWGLTHGPQCWTTIGWWKLQGRWQSSVAQNRNTDDTHIVWCVQQSLTILSYVGGDTELYSSHQEVAWGLQEILVPTSGQWETNSLLGRLGKCRMEIDPVSNFQEFPTISLLKVQLD